MAAPEIGVRDRWAPEPHATVDWQHPLAQGLVFFALGGWDLVSGRQMDPPPGPGVKATEYGPSWNATGSGPKLVQRVTLTTFHSFFAIGYYEGGSVYDGLVGFGNTTSEGSWLLMDTANNRLTLLFRGVAVYDVATGLTAAQVYTFGCTVAGDGGTTFGYVNGQRKNSATVGTMNPITTTPTFQICSNSSDNANPMSANAGIVVGAIYNRVLSDAEMAQLHAGPYSMLRY